MDIEEFVKNVQPGKKISRLKQYTREINELKDKGYTDAQIQSWLATIGVSISREAVRRFAKKAAGAPVAKDKAPNESENVETPSGQTESQAEKMKKRLAEQQSEADKSRFTHDKSGKF